MKLFDKNKIEDFKTKKKLYSEIISLKKSIEKQLGSLSTEKYKMVNKTLNFKQEYIKPTYVPNINKGRTWVNYIEISYIVPYILSPSVSFKYIFETIDYEDDEDIAREKIECSHEPTYNLDLKKLSVENLEKILKDLVFLEKEIIELKKI